MTPTAKQGLLAAYRLDFGDGWLSKPARDLMQIAVVFGNYPRAELAERVVRASGTHKLTRRPVVERVLDEMFHEQI
jgi:hypothetical protein